MSSKKAKKSKISSISEDMAVYMEHKGVIKD
jgi:hypothetical protein